MVPWHFETEDLTFYRQSPEGPLEMHIHLRGALGWFYYLHLAPGA